MLDWLKKRWELVLAGLVGIIAFLGRRGKSAAEDQVELKEEMEVIKKQQMKKAKEKRQRYKIP